MAKLILSVDGQVLKEFTLSKERTLIGRKAHNDIQIDNLAVSGEHAAIITILNDSFIEDLGSTNGTMVNGKPIKKHFLQNNDVVELGKHKLKYFNDAPTAATAADFEKTMIIRNPAKAAPPPAPDKSLSDTQTGLKPLGADAPKPPEAPKAPEMMPRHVTEAPKPQEMPKHVAEAPKPPPEMPRPAPQMPKPAPEMPRPPSAAPAHAAPSQPAGAAGAMREAAVQVLSGAAAGRTLDLTKNLTTIGKPGLQVAVITKRPNGFFITHVEGATFPTLNGTSLGAQAHPLNDHDLIEIAGVKMEFFYKP